MPGGASARRRLGVLAYDVQELDSGLEWMPIQSTEFAVSNFHVDCTLSVIDQNGQWHRLQAQFRD